MLNVRSRILVKVGIREELQILGEEFYPGVELGMHFKYEEEF